MASTATTSGVNVPTNAYPASGATEFYNATDGNNMGSYSSISSTPIAGANQPLSIIQPYLAMNFIIAVEGIFPSRN
jgi:microcystin-dependent protein